MVPALLRRRLNHSLRQQNNSHYYKNISCFRYGFPLLLTISINYRCYALVIVPPLAPTGTVLPRALLLPLRGSDTKVAAAPT